MTTGWPRWTALALALLATAAGAEERRVRFAPGQDGTTVSARIAGDGDVTWVLGAGQGQRMSVALTASNASANFNILPPGRTEALFSSTTGGSRFDGVLPDSGDYRIVVFLMRSAARRSETAEVALDIRIVAEALPADFADGLSGGPDWWRVEGLAPGDSLNLRAGPSTRSAVLARLQNGDILRNLGCTMTGATRWCRISSGLGRGWAAGRYLRESAAP